MDHFNIKTTEMRADAFTNATAQEAGTWLRLMLYCVAVENRGRIEGCAGWTSKQWLVTAGLDQDEIPNCNCALWSWDGSSLEVWNYPHHHQTNVEIKRAQGHHGSKGGRPPKTLPDTHPETLQANPKDKVREEKIKEGEHLSAPEGAGLPADSAPGLTSDGFKAGSGTQKKEGGAGESLELVVEDVPAPLPLSWAPGTGWVGFTQDLWDELARAYPACDIRRQMLAMEQWLKANTQRARKSNWRKFVTNWLAKEQDRGGDMRGMPPLAWSGLGAKNEGGAAKPLITIEDAPEGHEHAMEALFGEQWREMCPAWPQMIASDKAQVRAWLREHGKEAA